MKGAFQKVPNKNKKNELTQVGGTGPLPHFTQINQCCTQVRDITDLRFWKYVIVFVPDEILIELFQIDETKLPPHYLEYFE